MFKEFAFEGDKKEESMGLIIGSTAFKHNGVIPEEFTCDGKNVSPPLYWKNVPNNAKSLALIVDDPDAPKGTWVHWIVYNIDPGILEFSQDLKNSSKEYKTQMKTGKTNFKHTDYGGPCPPSGTHRYFFKLYALNCILDLPGGKSKNEIENAMEGHVIEMGELIGLYSKK